MVCLRKTMQPNFVVALIINKQKTLCMNDANRDLLVLSKTVHLNPGEMERQVELLNTMLYHTENWDVFCIANEVLDINRHKIIQKTFLIQKILTERKQKPFVFVCNKN